MADSKKKEKMSGKKLANIIVDVVFGVFFIFALAFTVLAFTARTSTTGYPTIGNIIMLTVESDSMDSKDGFKKNDLIYSTVLTTLDAKQGQDKFSELEAKRIDELKELKVNDVITFKYLTSQGQLILNTHRIIEVPTSITNQDALFVTHGDANPSGMNESVKAGDILAVWTGKKTAGLGGVITFLQPPHVGFFVVIILPLAGFLAYEIVVLVLTVKKINNTDKRTISKAEEELIKQKAIEEYLEKQKAETAKSKKTTKK